MNFKLFGILSVFLFISYIISAKQYVLNSADSLHVFIGSGENQVLIPVPDSVAVKNPVVQVESANTGLLEIVAYFGTDIAMVCASPSDQFGI